MKHNYLIFSILLLIAFEGCKKSGGSSGTTTTNPDPAPTSASYTLQVTGGDGSGKYAVGDSAYVFSDPPSSTQVFDKWTGDVSNLASPNEWRSTLKMPAANVNITASYKTIPAITFTNTVINGSQVYYYTPASYRGVILAFHGTGGSAANWTEQQAENMNFCRYAAANGYAIVVTESKNRTTMQWELSATNNVDVTNIDVILASLRSSNIISSTAPLYGVGMSDGSAFCSLITYLRNYKAGALYCYGGVDKVFPLSSIPIIWNMAVNDITDDPNRQITAYANYHVLLNKGISCVYYVNQPTPLYDNRFAINAGINTTASASIYNALKTGGYLDSKNFLKADPAVDSTWQAAIPAPYNTLATRAIEDQLYVCYAQHKFYKDSNYRTIQFFNRF